MGRFRTMRLLDDRDLDALLATAGGPTAIGAAEPSIEEGAFARMVAAAKVLIAAGDIYQANLTFPATAPVSGHPVALFRRLWQVARPPLAALVHRGGGAWWLSLSPELFFRLAAGAIVTRPMKGTARRLADPAADAAAAAGLAADPKNRAENLMITDLIRNDLSRIAESGSVRVDRLFAVERFATVHQMTSTVVARTRADAAGVLAALFPCGSITGAPKVRAMEVIAALEQRPRGLYCGAIGWIAPGGGEAAFSVAIRTLELEPGTPGVARLGLGAGIVADSDAAAEWAECRAKGAFLTAARPGALIETMRRETDGTIPRLGRHLDRLAGSADWLGWPLDRAAIEARLATLPAAATDQRLRLLAGESGAFAVQLSAAPPAPSRPWRVALSALPVTADDWRLHHKSDARGFYDRARREAGTDEVLFVDRDGRLTEGSFTSLFVERDGRLLTPAGPGLLKGVLRAELLDGGLAQEAWLGTADLADGFLLGNSLRGLVRAVLASGRRQRSRSRQ
jgi:para-aminobenzoate synthetase/4-amino-4-deoxychorismate lyase